MIRKLLVALGLAAALGFLPAAAAAHEGHDRGTRAKKIKKSKAKKAAMVFTRRREPT
jgi:hypothetical protein